MTALSLHKTLNDLINQSNLSENDSYQLFMKIMTGEVSEIMLSSLLTALRIKGETIEEITGAARAMRELSLKVPVTQTSHLIDIVGTGGDGQNLFNVSTASSFVAAAAGANVAKHGNRGVSSSSGSSDLLEQAGIRLDLSIEQTQRCIEDIGIGFLYAPNHHKAMKHAIGVRRELKIRSIFNVLGPLTNPAGVTKLLVGVFAKELCEPMAKVYQNLGAEHVMVVHSDDGLDEISLAKPTFVAELKNNQITTYTLSPKDVGVEPQSLDGLSVASKSDSLKIIKSAFSRNKATQKYADATIAEKAADMIALNAGAAIYIAGITATLQLGVDLAQDILAGGQASEKLDNLAEFTRSMNALGAD